MLTPPRGLSHDDLLGAIESAWGFDVESLEYLAVGFGSHHWVATDHRGIRHFVTVDELSGASRLGDEVSVLGLHLRPALTTATDLRAVGCQFVVAPMATKAGDPLVQSDGYAIALFPFIEGTSYAPDHPFGEPERERVLQLLIALHLVPITAIRPPALDEFVVPWLDELDPSMHRPSGSSGPFAPRASQLLIDNEAAIRGLTLRYRALVARYLSDPGPVVVTHGEIHPGNVMATPEGWVIVDWDTVLVGPRERDLWRLAPGGGSALRAYADATGSAPDEELVDLYRIRWDLAEIASFAAELRRPHEDTEDGRVALDTLSSVVGRLGT